MSYSYVALLRGINVGGNNKISMKELKLALEKNNFENVFTYLNSGNLFFSSNLKSDLAKKISEIIKVEFNLEIKVLVINSQKAKAIAEAIPKNWLNNEEQKTDIAYLFEEVNNEEIINNLPIKKEFLTLKYIDGALIWNLKKENYNKCDFKKLISSKIYKEMTIRNVNTARKIAELT